MKLKAALIETPPWEVDRALTLERLHALQELALPVDAEVRRDHRPELGEGALSLGARRYERTVARFEAASEEYDWFSVETRNNECILSIDGVSVKFCYDDPQAPRQRHVSGSTWEQDRRQGRLFDRLPPIDVSSLSGLSWRFFFEVERPGYVRLHVSLCDLDAGEVRTRYTVPVEKALPDVGKVVAAVEMEPARVAKRRKIGDSVQDAENAG